MSEIRFGSVCSGIEAASVAWHPLGWQAAWLAEIEPFPSAVLKHHYPEVPNYGDMTALPERIRSGEVEAPDVFCGGTPCQAFSVAGKRGSLSDARGNLSLTFCEIADAIDESRSVRGLGAATVFWENVPGVLSTGDNAFGCFLAQLCGGDEPLDAPDGWPDAGCVSGPRRTAAWRVLDAQYFGLAQRRRRVFVVASAREGFDPAAVLFEFDGLRRDTAPSREAGQRTTHATAPCLTSSGRGVERTGDTRGQDPVVAMCLNAKGGAGRMDAESETLIPTTGGGFDASEDGTGRRTPLVPVAFHPTQDPISSTDVCHSIGANANATAAVAQPIPINTMVALRHEALGEGTGFGIGEPGDSDYTLTKGHSHAVAFASQPIGWSGELTASVDLAGTIQRGCDGGRHDGVMTPTMQVRRLTPVECERLQGFPDGYTNIPWRGKPESPDGPRYKALGNSWAVPVVRWIGRRMNDALQGER